MLLAMSGVRKRFGATLALENVTFSIEGRAVGLLGPNGAGKTTLMKVCLGLTAPDAGDVRVLDLDAVRDPNAVRARLGYAAEGPGRIPGLSGLESVAYAAELCGVPRREALLRAHDMLDLVGLDESRYRPVETFSTGMHQRVKLAMALVHDPELVLLDEPTSGLDPESRDELLDLIAQLRDRQGPAVLLSTHLLHDVERTCDACVIMQAGRVLFAGRLDELRQFAPATWELRLGEPSPALALALTRRGARVEPGPRREIVYVTLPDGAGPDVLWAEAAALRLPIVHLEPRASSLEEAFFEKIGVPMGGR